MDRLVRFGTDVVKRLAERRSLHTALAYYAGLTVLSRRVVPPLLSLCKQTCATGHGASHLLSLHRMKTGSDLTVRVNHHRCASYQATPVTESARLPPAK